jgi:hypothetical protein
MFILTIALPAERGRCGSLSLAREGGEVLLSDIAVAGRASAALAQAHGNAARDPVLPYGDTPTGTYRWGEAYASGDGTALPARHYGPHGVLLLTPVSGQGLLARGAGRQILLIHGGPLGPRGRLRSTAGALRLANEDMQALVALLGPAPHFTGLCYEADGDGGAPVHDDPHCALAEPVLLAQAAALLPAGPPHALSRRNVLRAGGAALVLPVSFAAAPSPAMAQTAYNGASSTTPDNGQTAPDSGQTVVQLNPAATDVGGPAAVEGATPAHSALDQLVNATNGSETTGQAFDNGQGQSDATINSPMPNPDTPDATAVPNDQSLPPDVVNDPDVQSAAQDYNENAEAAIVAAAAFATAQQNWNALKAQPNPPAAQLTQAYAALNKAQAQKTFTEYKAKTSKETLQKKVRFILDKSGAPLQPNVTVSK